MRQELRADLVERMRLQKIMAENSGPVLEIECTDSEDEQRRRLIWILARELFSDYTVEHLVIKHRVSRADISRYSWIVKQEQIFERGMVT